MRKVCWEFKDMRTVTAREMQLLDRLAIEKYGIPSLALMENAGCGVARLAAGFLDNKKALMTIFCGLGNNGGDGFVAARHLVNAGFKIQVIIIGDVKKLKGDASVNYHILKKCRYPVRAISRMNRFSVDQIGGSGLLIDALFGTGLTRDLEGPYSEVIRALNGSGKRILAIDVPSGLDATTGRVLGVAVQATWTATLALVKKGFSRAEGPRHVGKVLVVDIGIPRKILRGS